MTDRHPFPVYQIPLCCSQCGAEWEGPRLTPLAPGELRREDTCDACLTTREVEIQRKVAQGMDKARATDEVLQRMATLRHAGRLRGHDRFGEVLTSDERR